MPQGWVCWGALHSCSQSSAVEPGEGQMGKVGYMENALCRSGRSRI